MLSPHRGIRSTSRIESLTTPEVAAVRRKLVARGRFYTAIADRKLSTQVPEKKKRHLERWL